MNSRPGSFSGATRAVYKERTWRARGRLGEPKKTRGGWITRGKEVCIETSELEK